VIQFVQAEDCYAPMGRRQCQQSRAGVGAKVSAIDSSGRTIWIADAHRGDGKRFVVCLDHVARGIVDEPSRLELVNCEAKFLFASLENLKSLSDRLHESALIAQLFG
jgi:hypothetical protein